MATCNSLFQLEDVYMIGGDYKQFSIRVLNTDSGINISGADAEVMFAVIHYQDRLGNPVITKECDVDENDNTLFIVELDTAETVDLFGQYIYQFSVRSPKAPTGKVANYQGLMNVDKNINPTAFTHISS